MQNERNHTNIPSETTMSSTTQSIIQRQQGNEGNSIQAKANALIVNPQSPYQTREGKLGPVKSISGQQRPIQAKQRVIQAKQVPYKSKHAPLHLAR